MIADSSLPTFNNLSARELATFQSLISQPDAFQKLMSAMSMPGGLPTIPQSSGPNLTPQPTHSSTFPMDYTPSGYAFDPHMMHSSSDSGPLVTTTNNYPGFGQTNAFDAFQPPNPGLGSYDPDTFLALLSGNSAVNNRGIEGSMSDLELANTLDTQTNNITRAYADTNAINAEVDSIQNSINSLIEQMGLDPATLSQMNDTGSVAPLDLPSHPKVESDTISAAGISAAPDVRAPATVDPSTPKISTGEDAATNASGSPRSSLEVADEQTSRKAPKARSSKRRARVMETDPTSNETTPTRSQRGSRKK